MQGSIVIMKYSWECRSPDQGSLKIAYECVHLLHCSKKGMAHILEEGLANWFQNELVYHHERVRRYIVADKYDRPVQRTKKPCIWCVRIFSAFFRL